MEITVATVVLLIVVVGIWFAVTYNRFVRLRNLLKEAWSGIDVQLKRRTDLIPNIVETVKGYTGHERRVFEDVASLRSGPLQSGNTRERGAAENALAQSIKSLFAIAEAYPELKANEQFLLLQRTLTEVEEQIQFARRYYNGTVRNFNILVQSFPSNLLAGIFGFHTEDYFEIELVTQREAPSVHIS